MAKGKGYIDPDEYHAIMTECKIKGELSNKAIEMYYLLVREVSKNFYFEREEEREDAISSAVHDLVRYWKNFKHTYVCQIFLERNFAVGESIEVEIPTHNNKFKFTAQQKIKNKSEEFQIDETINKSLENLSNAINANCGSILASSLHKVTRKITLVDCNNYDNKKYGKVVLTQKLKENLMKNDKTTGLVKNLNFNDPSGAFKFYTSYAHNGIIKYLNEHHPEETRNGNLIHFSAINKEKNGFYNS
jgi:hypothetical protein